MHALLRKGAGGEISKNKFKLLLFISFHWNQLQIGWNETRSLTWCFSSILLDKIKSMSSTKNLRMYILKCTYYMHIFTKSMLYSWHELTEPNINKSIICMKNEIYTALQSSALLPDCSGNMLWIFGVSDGVIDITVFESQTLQNKKVKWKSMKS